MDWRTRLNYLQLLWRHAATPLPLMLDCLRLMPKPYDVQLKNGLRFRLEGGRGEWHSLMECAIRLDYLQHGIKLAEGGVVVDIGANIGSFAIVAAQRVGKTGRVYAYEPNPSAFERLKANVALNGLTNVVAINEAVGKEDGVLQFHISRNSAFGSLYAQVDDHAHGEGETVQANVRSITTVLREAGPRIDLLKMDCEGSEYDILESVSPQEFAAVRQLSMEVHSIEDKSPAEIPAALKRLGLEPKVTFPLTAFRMA